MDPSSTAQLDPAAATERVVVWQRCLPSGPAAEAATDAFCSEVLTQVEVRGGQPLAQLGSTLVFAFEAVDSEEAVELALSLMGTAKRTADLPEVGFGVAIGPVSPRTLRGGRGLWGAVFDRAQALSSTDRSYEITVDETVHDRLGDHYLFGRESSVGGFRGHALDLDTPRKRDCRATMRELRRPPILPGRKAAFEALRKRADGKLERGVLLRAGQPFEALDWLSRIAEVALPPFQLHLRWQAAGLQPLGSLQAALVQGMGQPGLRATLAELRAGDQVILRAIMDGNAVNRADVAQALAALLSHNQDSPWVVLHRLHDIDAATLGVLAECRTLMASPPLLFAGLPWNAPVPEVLFPERDRHEVFIEDLTMDERLATAAAILDLKSDSPIARRIALLSEPTLLGVIEACRTLVASGDLVRNEGGFRWRVGPRSTQDSIPAEALITERMAGASPMAFRMLEVLSVAPPGGGRDLCLRVAKLDGASPEEAAEGFARLEEEAFVKDGTVELGAWEAAVRSAVRNAMPPARSAELHRFVAACLLTREAKLQGRQGFGRALLAHHQAEGGHAEDAARSLLDAAEDALKCGFQRMAVRLAATAIELDPSDDAQGRARSLTATFDGQQAQPAPENARARTFTPPELDGRNLAKSEDGLTRKAMKEAVSALLRADTENVERLLDTATAAGGSRAAARRLRAISLVLQDDLEQAMQTLKQGAQAGKEDPRDALSQALIRLRSGDAQPALRHALSALGMARRSEDKRGQQAALLVLSACYAATDNTEQANQLREAAEALRA